jgi:epoxyqueuosine reductase
MTYLEKRKEAYSHPSGVLEGCVSLIMLGMPYYSNPETLPNKSKQMQHGSGAATGSGSSKSESHIGTYAVGPLDYHDVIREKLNSICAVLKEQFSGNYRGVVDTAPLLEREFAELAGLGWIGKNTLLLNRDWGSYFFIAAILTDVELETTNHIESDHCGSCTACLDACPTGAFPQPRVLDATKCISYLTIEHRGESHEALRSQMGDWIFGCDVCQIVCPWNRKRPDAGMPWFEPMDVETKTSLEHWLELDDQTFRQLYRKTPFFRTKLAGMQRNAMVAAVNRNRVDLLSKIEVFCTHEDVVLKSTADWAVKCLKGWIAI